MDNAVKHPITPRVNTLSNSRGGIGFSASAHPVKLLENASHHLFLQKTSVVVEGGSLWSKSEFLKLSVASPLASVIDTRASPNPKT